MSKRPLLLIGVGIAAQAVAALVQNKRKAYGTSRNPNRMLELVGLGLEPIIMPCPSVEIIEPLANGADVLISFPPDGTTDNAIARACRRANKIVYISSTFVYGAVQGEVNDKTPVSASLDTELRLDAEATWRKVGAIVLRAPGIYCAKSGLHTRLLSGTYKIPGDGSGIISRIHAEDLAQFVLAAFERGSKGETYLVGDLAPVPQIEVINWLCEKLNLPVPPQAPLEAVPQVLRGNRAVDPSRALQELGVCLKYPSYKEGFVNCLESSHRP